MLLLPARSPTAWIDSLAAQVSTGLLLWISAYHYLALRRYFGEGRIRTALKFAVLMLFYCCCRPRWSSCSQSPC